MKIQTAGAAIQDKFSAFLMCEIKKFEIKKIVQDAVQMKRGVQGKLAEDYGHSEYWASDIFNPASETDGFVYPYLLFMKRLARRSPEGLAMIDDEVRRIVDELRGERPRLTQAPTLDDVLRTVNGAHFDMQTAYRDRRPRREIRALAAKLSAHIGNLLRAIDAEEELNSRRATREGDAVQV